MKFAKAWAGILWEAMHKTQKGCRLNSRKNTGRGNDRRADKLVDDTGKQPLPAILRRYQSRYPVRQG